MARKKKQKARACYPKVVSKHPRVRHTRSGASSVILIDDWPPVGAIQLGPYSLAAGEYWTGDLYNVLNYESWEEMGTMNGYKKLHNREVVRFKLPEGNGNYVGKQDELFFIDSGTVGITLLSGLGQEARDTGHITVFSDDFECMSITVAHPQGGGDVSFIKFGENVQINSEDQVYSTNQSLREKLAVHKFATRLRAC